MLASEQKSESGPLRWKRVDWGFNLQLSFKLEVSWREAFFFYSFSPSKPRWEPFIIVWREAHLRTLLRVKFLNIVLGTSFQAPFQPSFCPMTSNWSRYFIPSLFGIFLSLDMETMCDGSKTHSEVYKDHSECRLPFSHSEFFNGVMKFYEITHAHLPPNSIGFLIAFEVLCRLNNIGYTSKLLNHLFHLNQGNNNKKGSFYLRALPSYKILSNFVSNIHGWKEKCCFIYSPGHWAFIRVGGVPRMGTITSFEPSSRMRTTTSIICEPFRKKVGQFDAKLLTDE